MGILRFVARFRAQLSGALTIGCLSAVAVAAVADPHEIVRNGFDYSVNKPPDKATLDIFRGATRVEAFRVSDMVPEVGPAPAPPLPPPGSSIAFPPIPSTGSNLPNHSRYPQIDGLSITHFGPIYGAGFARKVEKIAADSKNYARYGTACLMQPGVVFRVWNGRSYADVILCFHCWQIAIDGYGSSGKQISETSGNMAGVAWFRLSQQAFPKDVELHKL